MLLQVERLRIFPGNFSTALCGLIRSHEEIKTIWLQSFAWEGRPLEAETSHYGFTPPGVCGDQRVASFTLRYSAGHGPSALEPGGPAAGGAQTRWPDWYACEPSKCALQARGAEVLRVSDGRGARLNLINLRIKHFHNMCRYRIQSKTDLKLKRSLKLRF